LYSKVNTTFVKRFTMRGISAEVHVSTKDHTVAATHTHTHVYLQV